MNSSSYELMKVDYISKHDEICVPVGQSMFSFTVERETSIIFFDIEVWVSTAGGQTLLFFRV